KNIQQFRIELLLLVIPQETDQQVSCRVVFRISLSNCVGIPALVYRTISSNEVMIRNIGPFAIGTHTPCLDILYSSCAIIKRSKYTTAFMMHGDAHRCMLAEWFGFRCLPP